MHYPLKTAPWAQDFAEACRTWSRFVTAALDFEAGQPERCLTVVNEALSASPRDNFRRILQFVDAFPESGPAEFFANNRINSSFPLGDAHKGMEQSRKDPWELWTPEQRTVFAELTGDCYGLYHRIADQALTPDVLGFQSKSSCDHALQQAADHPASSPFHSLQSEAQRGVQNEVQRAIPASSTVLVVSKGDEELLSLGGRTAWHFPRSEDGEYAGHYPADSAEAIAHLESLRSQGAEFLLFPEPAFWWLDHYGAFREYLASRYFVAARRADTCVIFDLRAQNLSAARDVERQSLA
jgi:hypothetical protein